MLSHVKIIVQKLFVHFMVSKGPKNELRRQSNAKIIPPLCYFQWFRPPRTFETISNWTIDLQSISNSSETLISWINNRALRHHFGDKLSKKEQKKGKNLKIVRFLVYEPLKF